MFVLSSHFEFQPGLCEFECYCPVVFVGKTEEEVFTKAIQEWFNILQPDTLVTLSQAKYDHERVFLDALDNMANFSIEEGLELAKELLGDVQVYWTLTGV